MKWGSSVGNLGKTLIIRVGGMDNGLIHMGGEIRVYPIVRGCCFVYSGVYINEHEEVFVDPVCYIRIACFVLSSGN
jgi:hypothetical protein